MLQLQEVGLSMQASPLLKVLLKKKEKNELTFQASVIPVFLVVPLCAYESEAKPEEARSREVSHPGCVNELGASCHCLCWTAVACCLFAGCCFELKSVHDTAGAHTRTHTRTHTCCNVCVAVMRRTGAPLPSRKSIGVGHVACSVNVWWSCALRFGAQCPSLFYRPLVSVDFGLRLGCCLRLVCVNLSLDLTLDRHHFMGKF